MHKFLGGVQTPGILVAKKKLFQNPVPVSCGGGTVSFVTNEDHKYLQDTESREEGGTPGIVESIRAGICMQLKQNFLSGNETGFIMTREGELMDKADSHDLKILNHF